MVDQALEIIRKEVNDYIDAKVGGGGADNHVALTSFVDGNGGVRIPDDSIGLSLLNIEEEKHLKRAGLVQAAKSEEGSQFLMPPVRLNLQIMFAAYFNQYQESLKHISYIITYFQNKPMFDAENTPDMDDLEVKKLVFELNTLGLEQQHYIWSMIGVPYLPSSIYRVRMLVVQDSDSAVAIPNIKEINTAGNLKEIND